MSLSKEGFKLRNAIAEAGFEVTPLELSDALKESCERISKGKCQFCNDSGDGTELRYGMCFKCFAKENDRLTVF